MKIHRSWPINPATLPYLMIVYSIINILFREDIKDRKDMMGSEWQRLFGTSPPVNFGFGGDKIEKTMWRIEQGPLPQVGTVIIHCGTNNLKRNSKEEIASGICQLANMVKQRLPKSRVVITGIFHRGSKVHDSRYGRDAINSLNYMVREYSSNLVDIGYYPMTSWVPTIMILIFYIWAI